MSDKASTHRLAPDQLGSRLHSSNESKFSERINAAVAALRESDTDEIEPEVFFDRLLGALLELSGSRFGIIGEPRVGRDEQPYVVVYSVLGPGLSRHHDMVRRIIEIENADAAILRAIDEKRPIISDGHDMPWLPSAVRLNGESQRSVSVPLLFGGQLVGIVCMADREQGYDSELVEGLQPLLTSGAQSIAAFKGENRLRFVEEALRASEIRFRTAADFSYNWESWWNREGALFFVSPSFERITGYETESLVADSTLLQRIIHPEDRARCADHFQHGKSAHDETLEFRITTKNGREKWIEHACHIVRNSNGEIVGRRASNRDITARKRAEETQEALQTELQLSATTWQATFDAVDDLILILNRERCVRRMNKAAINFLGREHSFAAGGHIDEYPDTQPWSAIRDLVSTERDGETRETARQVVEEASGRTWEITWSTATIEEDDDELFIIVARDVSQLVALRDALKQSETMSAMGELVGGVAHEVRNPVFALSAVVEAFKQRFGEREDFQRYFEAIDTQLERMKFFMKQLLDYGRAEDLKRQQVSLKVLVSDALALCDQKLEDTEVGVEHQLRNCAMTICADRARMTTAVSSILDNAAHFAPAGSVITVACRALEHEGAPWVEVQIRDRGPGFEADSIERIFSPFFTRRPGGTGLGLAIAQRVIVSHGGRIEASNAAGGGARVVIQLPASNAETSVEQGG